MRTKIILLVTLCCFASCAKWLKKKDDDENNASPNNAVMASTNNETTAPAADCSGAAVGPTIPFDAGGMLPFSFAINARFGNIDSSTMEAVAGATFDVVGTMPGEFEAAYAVKRDPIDDPSELEADWEARDRESTVVTFDGSMLSAWKFESDERDAVYFMAPHDGDVYEATLEWTGPVGCIDERRALRDLATSTLSSVDETSFP